MPLKEIHYKRFIEVVKNGYDKIWTIDELLKRINRLLPSNIVMTERSLSNLIITQQQFKVFRCKSHGKIYYNFRRYLPGET